MVRRGRRPGGSRVLPEAGHGPVLQVRRRWRQASEKNPRQTKGLGCAVKRPNGRGHPGCARRDLIDIVAGDRFGGADEPNDEQADGTGPTGRPFREIGERAKQGCEGGAAAFRFSRWLDGNAWPGPLVWAKYAAGAEGCGQTGRKKNVEG